MDNAIKTLNYIRQSGSQTYAERVPLATKTNIKDVGNAITEYAPNMNEFITELVNKIALTEVLTSSPDSVFGEFVGKDLLYGDTIESIFVKIAKAKEFEGDSLANGDTIDPFAVQKPAIEVAYHRVDRKVYYTLTVQEANIKNAFQSAGAFSAFMSGIMSSLTNAVEYDLYADGLELLDRDGSLGKTDIYGVKEDLGEYTDNFELAKAVNRAIKHHTTYLPFMNTKYNPLEVMTNTPKGDIVIFIRADIKDLIDSELIANTFNPGKLDAGVKVKLVDEFIDPHQVVAILDRKALKINHSLKRTTSQENARALYTNYFSHVHRLVSYNPFANAVKISAKAVIATP